MHTTPEQVMPRHPTDLWPQIHLGKELCMDVGDRPRAGHVWEKKPDNWPKVTKDWKELPHVNDLTTSLLGSSPLGGCPHPFSPCVYLWPCFCPNSTNYYSACSPTSCVSNNKLRVGFYSFCLLEECSFQWGQEPGEFCL